MKKSFLILLSVLLIAMLAFAGCKNNDDENNSEAKTEGKTEAQTEGTTEHTHTFAEEWSSDAENHWHASTCDHKDEKSDVAAHVDEDGDGMCDVCKYSSCEHTYDESKWASDADSHWYASTCGHNVRKDESAHKDENKDGICDICEYVVCAHTYADAWSSNELSHWKMSTCGCFVIKDEANHDMAGEGGSCSVCGAENVMSGIIDLVTGEDAADRIASGTIKYNNSTITYQFGKDYTHILNADGSEWAETYEYWHYLLGDGSTFSLQNYRYRGDELGSTSKMSTDESYLKGYQFLLNNIVFNSKKAYGVEDYIYELYHYGDEDADIAKTYVANYDAESGEYGFAFYVLAKDSTGAYTKATTVVVTLKMSENGAIASAKVEINAYWDEESDFTVDADGKLTIMPEAEADSTDIYEITQVEGEKNATPKYDLDTILAKSFTITDGEGNAYTTDSTVCVGDKVTFKLSGITPDLANLRFDTPAFSATINGNPYSWFWVDFDVDTLTGTFTMSVQEIGTFELTVTTAQCSISVEFEVIPAEVKSVTSMVVEDGWWDEEKSEITVSVGDKVEFKATPDNSYADHEFTATVDKEDGYTLGEYSSVNKSMTFTASKAGTYVITMASKSNPDATATLTITVEGGDEGDTNIDASAILNGVWSVKEEMLYTANGNMEFHTVTMTFTPEGEGATNGSLLIVDDFYHYIRGNKEGAVETINYTYSYADGVITLIFVSGNHDGDDDVYAIESTNDISREFTLAINAKGQLTATCWNPITDTATLTLKQASGESSDADNNFIGLWGCYEGEEKIWALTIDADGVSLYECEYGNEETFGYEIEDGVLIASDDFGPYIALEYNEEDGTLTLHYYDYSGEIDESQGTLTFTLDM